MLTAGMMKGRTPADIEATVRALGTRETYFSHGSAIDHREATALGLRVKYLPTGDELWERIWLLYCMYDYDLLRDGNLKVFEGRARSTAVSAKT